MPIWRECSDATSPTNRVCDQSKDDPYQLDADGFPKDQTTLDAIEFMEQSKASLSFFTMPPGSCTPIHSRSKDLLEKYCKKLGVDFPTDPKGWPLEGQKNPYYCAMVEMFDHYVGNLVKYLENTDDPRRPGHKLMENTYIMLTSDNGGMERVPVKLLLIIIPWIVGKLMRRRVGCVCLS